MVQLRSGESLLRGLLTERLPEWRLPEVEGGLVLWTNLGRPVASEFALLARAEGVQLGAGPRFSVAYGASTGCRSKPATSAVSVPRPSTAKAAAPRLTCPATFVWSSEALPCATVRLRTSL